MATDLEKQFFDTFGIEFNLSENAYFTGTIGYPQISDRILLELVVIMTRYTDIIEGFDSIDELKNFVLTDLMYSLTQSEADIVKQQVQALFKEG